MDGDGVDGGQAGTGARPVDQAADILVRAFEDRLYPAVGQVADPARHAVLLSQPPAAVAEENALDPPGDQHPIAHHKQTVRQGAVGDGRAGDPRRSGSGVRAAEGGEYGRVVLQAGVPDHRECDDRHAGQLVLPGCN